MVPRNASIAVYIMTNRPYGALYVGVSSLFEASLVQHREKLLKGFTKKYGLTRLVWYETHDDMTVAIHREKPLKEWPRQWKINLIERDNPRWDDLYDQVMNWTPAPRQF